MVTGYETRYAARFIEKAAGEAPMEFVLSEESEDRYGDVIVARGWQLENFKKNPIMLREHDHTKVVGTWRNVRVEGKQLRGNPVFDTGGVLGAEAERQVKAGVMVAVSVGFRPLDYEVMDSGDKDSFRPAMKFKKAELLEVSLVPVPAHPNALRVKSYGTRPICAEHDPWDRFINAFDRLAHALAGEVEKEYRAGRLSDADLRRMRLGR